METKNIIIRNFVSSLETMVSNLALSSQLLNDNADENRSTLKTLNVLLESVRSQTVNIQNAVDTYFE